MGVESTPLEFVFRRNHFKKYPPKYPPLHSIKTLTNIDVLLFWVREADFSRAFTDRDLEFTQVVKKQY